MAQQTKKVRHVQKHDVEANWLKATGFTPLAGEIVIYDKDEQHDFVRTKIGDGETNINDLPFVKNAIIDVVSLPTENINQEVIYRVLDTIAYDYGEPLYDPKINYVNALPEEGEGAIDFETDEASFYYNVSDGLVYCYVNEELSAAAGAEGTDLPVGWCPYDTFATFVGGPGTMILNVYALPEQGMPAMNLDTGDSWIYYYISENEAYCYIDKVLSEFINNQFGMTISIGWYLYSQLSSLADVNYQGIFTKKEDIPNEGLSILVNNTLYTYNNIWNQIDKAQIQVDWNQDDNTQPDYIKNKPDVAQSDWNITDESNPAIIKNKPFGMIEQIVDIVPEAEYDFYRPNETTTDIVCFSTPDFNDDQTYYVWFNDIYLDTVKPNEVIEIPNGQFSFSSGAIVIRGGNYPEGEYKVHIMGKQVIAKKLDSQWLNIQDNIYNGDMTDPVNGVAVATAINDIGLTVGNLSNTIVHRVIPAIGPIPTEADNGKVLTVKNATPVWEDFTNSLPTITTEDNGKLLQVVDGAWAAVSITNGNEVAY